ncbi:NADH-ubiquinone oxidoreductase-F iron-sulfur binding region domain-containing protein [Pseudonocardia sp. H11422]|uniref:NADH-ubiquinone oxidoreductase-F iron-sulfur binding region domain-containing protein n=1 Tax=Pseudonocardia sp. H11422 TaxID=2835866 RepID=UPI001BDCA419|nr:NADH-ubiquinone oxidoreductase-F iron-sulfur binding region domain-containing protein [Pseudonocardia sp. H11422]
MAVDPHSPRFALHEARSWRGDDSGLLGPTPFTRETRDVYAALGGYPARGAWDADLLDRLAGMPGMAALRGRGGAAFPAVTKIRAVAQGAVTAPSPPVVVANGAEGEPLSVKDRYLLRYRPHLVLDGLLTVAAALGAPAAYVYVADAMARASVETALAELAEPDIATTVHVFAAQDTYVAGEETAVVRALTTGIARPTDKPPRPFQVGVRGAPTLVLNVETLACIARAGLPAAPEAGATFLATVSGAGRPPVLYDLPIGLGLGELLREHLGRQDSSLDVLIGGFFGGVIPAWPDLELSHPGVARRGAGLGCGSLHLLESPACPVAVTADVVAFYAAHNAGQCGMCMASSTAVAATLAELGEPHPTRNYAALLPQWAGQLRGRGACAVPDAIAVLLRSLLQHHPQTVMRHLAAGCDRCRWAEGDPRWEHLVVTLPAPAGEPTDRRAAEPVPSGMSAR